MSIDFWTSCSDFRPITLPVQFTLMGLLFGSPHTITFTALRILASVLTLLCMDFSTPLWEVMFSLVAMAMLHRETDKEIFGKVTILQVVALVSSVKCLPLQMSHHVVGNSIIGNVSSWKEKDGAIRGSKVSRMSNRKCPVHSSQPSLLQVSLKYLYYK